MEPFPFEANEKTKSQWGIVAKLAVLDHFEWHYSELPACFWHFLVWSDVDFSEVYPYLNGVCKLLSKSTDLQRLYPAYKNNPVALLQVVRTATTKDELLDGVDQIKPSLIVFLNRYGIRNFTTESSAMLGVFGKEVSEQTLASFVRDSRVTSNLRRCCEPNQKLQAFIKRFTSL